MVLMQGAQALLPAPALSGPMRDVLLTPEPVAEGAIRQCLTAERVKLLAHHDQHTTPEDGLTGYKWTFAFGATPFPAIMPIGPHPRDAGAPDRPAAPAKGRRPLPA